MKIPPSGAGELLLRKIKVRGNPRQSMSEGSVALPTQPKNLEQEDKGAFRNIRTFSFLAIVSYVLYSVLFFTIFASYGVILRDEYAANHGFAFLTPGLVFMAALLVVGTILQLMSLVYLRSGYVLLRRTFAGIRSPLAGVAVYFAGTIIEVVFGIVIVGAEFRGFLQILDGYDSLWWLLLFLGVIMGFVGLILCLTLGSFRLKTRYNRSAFGYAGILFLLGLAFSPFGFIGAVLTYRVANSMIGDHTS